MRTPIKFYTVSGVVGEHRHTEYDIGATTEKQAKYFFSAPISKGGRGNGFRVFDWSVSEASSKQLTLNFQIQYTTKEDTDMPLIRIRDSSNQL